MICTLLYGGARGYFPKFLATCEQPYLKELVQASERGQPHAAGEGSMRCRNRNGAEEIFEAKKEKAEILPSLFCET
jgi:hypothetical protein